MRAPRSTVFALCVACSGGTIVSAQTTPEAPSADDVRALYETGQQLFETYAPDEIKAEFRFPSREEWDAFAIRLERALQNGTLEELASYKSEATAALAALRALPPEYHPFATWLQDRLDYIDVAAAVTQAPVPTPPPDAPVPPTPAVPYYDLWLTRLADRPVPARAPQLAADLADAFTEKGLPGSLVWLAEVESSFNPDARSPVGARGLFQIMPATAKELGLRLLPFDERTNPRKSARAAALYLDQLHERFNDWPLALAAYNAGPGRVSRTLKSRGATTYAAIAEHLPAETRMYVPKVLATIALRTNQPLAR